MSNREYAVNLIDNIPESKLIFVIKILESLKGLTNKSDEYDLQMVLDSQIDNDEEYTSEQINKMNQLDVQYLLRSQKSNYEQLLKMTDDDTLKAQIQIYIKIIDDTLSS